MAEIFAHLFTIENIAALFTLTIMEIVLGIDNLVFIAILAAKLPEGQQSKARKLGLFLAMFARIVLLFCIGFIMSLKQPLIEISDFALSGRDIVLILGGGFLVFNAVREIHDKIEGSKETLHQPAASAKFSSILTQIVMMDIIFSVDSVITAVGMVKTGSVSHGADAQAGVAAESVAPVATQALADVAATATQAAEVTAQAAAADPARPMWAAMTIMITAVVISIAVMIAFAEPISRFIQKHPTTKMLALAFLLLIGVVLIAEGFGAHIARGYIYSAMGFSILVEVMNQRASAKRRAKQTPAPKSDAASA